MNGAKAVFQCKRYGKQAGTDSVRQAYSALAFYAASFGAVIAPNGFTPGAVALSGKTGVHLFNPSELLKAHRVMGVPGDHRVMRVCPRCQARLRLPFGRWGRVRCPKCDKRFWCLTMWG